MARTPAAAAGSPKHKPSIRCAWRSACSRTWCRASSKPKISSARRVSRTFLCSRRAVLTAHRAPDLDPACALRKPACGRKCACTRRVNGIQILATLYSQQQAKLDAVPAASTTDAAAAADTPEALAEADASFLRGHLAVLFGLLMAGSAENEVAVLAALPSPFAVALAADAKKVKAAWRAKLARLAEQARDFAVFYTAVSGNIGGDKESKVAGAVVRFLEAKRDAGI